MKCNFELEINGIANIVINGTLYIRGEDRNWTNTSNNKVILDVHMWSRVKRMMHKERSIEETVRAPIAKETREICNFVPCYRAWVNTNSLNIEKIYYD